MQLLVSFLLLAAQPLMPETPEEIACAEPAENDARPYTLCLAESWFDRTEVELKLQLAATLASIEAARGASAAGRLRAEQQDWVERRDSECQEFAAPTPTTQHDRNDLSCRAQMTEARIAKLKALAGRVQSFGK